MTPRSLRLPALPAVVALGVAAALMPAVATATPAVARASAAALPATVHHTTTPTPTVPAIGAAFVKLPHFSLDLSAKLNAAPKVYQAYSVKLATVEATLDKAPTQAQVAHGARPLVFSVPAPDGTMARFAVAEDSVMQAGLQAAHPEIRTYAGRSLSGPTSSIRLDTSPLGFHASVRSPGGGAAWYVDPAYIGRGVTDHISYYGAAVPRSSEAFVERDLADTKRIESSMAHRVSTTPGGVVTQRVFRMAFVTDPTYAAYFGTTNVLAAKVALLNRTDQIYNDDLAIKFILIDGTDKLNLDTEKKASEPDGPCGASACIPVLTYTADPATAGDTPDGCDGSLLTRNEFVLGQLVGADNFDVGHIGLGVNGGGIAGLGVVGGASKADGCTGLPKPTGDFYAVDYFSHEVGHEMGGNHTFNGTQTNCATGNRNAGVPIIEPSTSVEPGSGTSVMAYAGICGTDNLQPHSDPYFSQRSIDEITSTTSAAPGTEDEEQTVTLSKFDTDGDSFQLSFPGASAPVTITRGTTSYNLLSLTQSLMTLTGCIVTIGGYDSTSPMPNDDGFTVTFNNPLDCAGTDEPRLAIGTTTGGVTGFVGVQVNGGDDTNIGQSTVVTKNHAPVVTAPADKTIPLRTPFTLSGSATDSDKDPLIYSWEQNDMGGAQGTGLIDNTKIDGPLFRIFGTYATVTADGTLMTPSPGENLQSAADATRTFPDMAQVLADNTNAETGVCPTPDATVDGTALHPVPLKLVDCYSEFLPTADYGAPAAGLPSLGGTLDFRLTARDLFPTGGGTAYDDVALTVDSSGPFEVTSRNTAGTPATAGTKELVTWDVNGTDTAPLALNVRVLLSTDGGQTFPYVLPDATGADQTANDGTEMMTLPQVSTAHARIKIEAVGNYFFDTNDADFKITGPLTVAEEGAGTAQYSDLFTGAMVTASSSKVDADQLTATVTGPAGIAIGTPVTSADGESPSTAVFPLTGKITAPPGTYTTTVTVTEPANAGNPAVTKSTTFDVTVTKEDAAAAYSGPTTVTTTKTSASVPLRATVVDAADGSAGLIDNATVTFVNRANGKTLCSAPVTGGPTHGTATCSVTVGAAKKPGNAITVGILVGGSYVGTAADKVVTVTQGVATALPDTLITYGPAFDSFVRSPQSVFRWKSTKLPATFRCTFDGKALPCKAGVRTPVLAPGRTHLLKVAAVDASGQVDKTPAVRRFASPYTVAMLTKATAGWTMKKDASAYRSTFLTTSKAGQVLTRKVSGFTKVSVVVGQAPKSGRIGVYLGKRLLRTINLTGPKTKSRILVSVKVFAAKTGGTISIRTLDNKPVRIEGLGVLVPRLN